MSARRPVLLALLVLACSVVVFVLAWDPVVEPDLRPARVEPDPERLDAWLAERERGYPDIRPGTEKHVEWLDPARPTRTPLAFVYLPGFSATRQEVSPLFEDAARDLSANVFFTRLAGHGRSSEAMAEATVQAWVDDAMEALAIGRVIGQRVILAGTSTGGTLALYLAARGAPVDGLIVISPNLGVRAKGSSLLLWPGRRLIVRMVVGPERSWTPQNEEHARYWTRRYPSEALFPMAELVELCRRADFHAIRIPVLAFWSRQDRVVQSERVPERLGEIPSATLVEVEDAGDESHHVLAGRILSPGTTDRLRREMVTFISKEVLSGIPFRVPGSPSDHVP